MQASLHTGQQVERDSSPVSRATGLLRGASAQPRAGGPRSREHAPLSLSTPSPAVTGSATAPRDGLTRHHLPPSPPPASGAAQAWPSPLPAVSSQQSPAQPAAGASAQGELRDFHGGLALPCPQPSPVTAQSRWAQVRVMPAFIGSVGLSLGTQARGHAAEEPRDTKDHAKGLRNIRVVRKGPGAVQGQVHHLDELSLLSQAPTRASLMGIRHLRIEHGLAGAAQSHARPAGRDSMC